MKFSFLATVKDKNVILVPEKEAGVFKDRQGKKTISIGVPEKINRRKFILLARNVVSSAKTNKVGRVVLNFPDFLLPGLKISDVEAAELMATNFEMADFEFSKYKTPPKDGWHSVKEVVIAGKISPAAKKAFEKGKIIGETVNFCRELANTPGGELTPQLLAAEAKNNSKGLGITVKVLDEKEMARLKMGGILGVAKGSAEKPRFIIMEYHHAGKEKPVALIGKGVTFDTGGLNLKPETGMGEMHMDMSGGAAVIAAIILAAKLKLKKNIVALIPAVENMPSGSSYRPGDVLRTMSGKTIEVLNTDAEGRIILADALTYAERYKPQLVVDVATLTGAAMMALGLRASAIFSNNDKLEKLTRELGEESGDYVWPLPLWEEYEEEIKGTFGDVANLGKTKYGGAITGAVFLWQFAKNFSNWLHIDIAPRMTSIDGEHLAKGAVGAPVRLIIKLLEKI